jgi:hypothetical protein
MIARHGSSGWRSRTEGESPSCGLRYDFEGARRSIKGATIGLEFAEGEGPHEAPRESRVDPDIEKGRSDPC